MNGFPLAIGLCALLASAAALAGCGEATAGADLAKIEGKVTDRNSGAPIAGAIVTTLPDVRAVRTDARGVYVLVALPPDQYTVVARKPGYSNGSADALGLPGKTTIADLQLDSGFVTRGAGTALRYDGADDHVSVPASGSFDLSAGSFTIEAWVNPARAASGGSIWNIILNKSHSNADLDYLLGIDAEGRFAFGSRAQSNLLRSASKANPKFWHHVAGVQDLESGTVTLYVNGIMEAQMPVAGVGTRNDAPLLVGAREYLAQGRVSDLFDGTIDEIRIWNVARTSGQLALAMYRSFAGGQPGLVANWRFDEGAGSSTADLSGSYIGYLIGGPAWVSSSAPIQ